MRFKHLHTWQYLGKHYWLTPWPECSSDRVYCGVPAEKDEHRIGLAANAVLRWRDVGCEDCLLLALECEPRRLAARREYGDRWELPEDAEMQEIRDALHNLRTPGRGRRHADRLAAFMDLDNKFLWSLKFRMASGEMWPRTVTP